MVDPSVESEPDPSVESEPDPSVGSVVESDVMLFVVTSEFLVVIAVPLTSMFESETVASVVSTNRTPSRSLPDCWMSVFVIDVPSAPSTKTASRPSAVPVIRTSSSSTQCGSGGFDMSDR